MTDNNALIYIVNISGKDGFVRGYVEERRDDVIATVSGDVLDDVYNFHIGVIGQLGAQDYVIMVLTKILGQIKTLSIIEGAECLVETFEPTLAWTMTISGAHYEDEE